MAQTPVAPEQTRLIEAALGGIDAAGESLPSITLTLDVHEAICGSWRAAVPVAAAGTCVYLGADILDNVADHELPAVWDGWSVDEVTLAGACLLGSLSYLALECLRPPQPPAERILGLVQRLASGTWTMAGGQLQDVRQGNDESPKAVEARVARKSGAELKMFAGLAAALATDDDRIVAGYENFGHALGVAAQLRSDCYDIWVNAPSSDLLNGRHTLPVAHALQVGGVDERTDLLALLERGRSDPGSHSQVASQLAAAGSLRYTAAAIDRWITWGITSLEAARPRQPAGARLRTRLSELALLPQA